MNINFLIEYTSLTSNPSRSRNGGEYSYWTVWAVDTATNKPLGYRFETSSEADVCPSCGRHEPLIERHLKQQCHLNAPVQMSAPDLSSLPEAKHQGNYLGAWNRGEFQLVKQFTTQQSADAKMH